MPKDHYVAETYLKHFVGAHNMLHVYRKSDGRCFPCRPNDICREADGDLVRDFLTDPTLLGQYRKIFEPAWNSAVADLRAGRLSQNARVAIAGYWGNLLVSTPVRLRIARSLKHSAEASHRRKSPPFRSAMSMLTLYINRAGSNLSGSRRRTLERA